MGFTDSDSTNCKWHPNQKQQPGVCSSCLRERLSQLSNALSFTRYRTTVVVSHSSTPSYSSTAAAASSDTLHRRIGSDADVSVGKFLNDGLKKSRSVSCALLSRSRGGAKYSSMGNFGKTSDGNSNEQNSGIEEKEGNRRKKGGFLKRFIIYSGSKKV